MRQQEVTEWKWLRKLKGWETPYTLHLRAYAPHCYEIQDKHEIAIARFMLLWSPTPEEIATYLNMAEVYYANDIQQESNHVR